MADAPKDCCEDLTVAVHRCNSKEIPQGITRSMFMNFKNGKCSMGLVMNLPKANKDDKSDTASIRDLPVAFCPFCGAKQLRELEEPEEADPNA